MRIGSVSKSREMSNRQDVMEGEHRAGDEAGEQTKTAEDGLVEA